MRNLNLLAVLAAVSLAGGVAVAAEKPAKAPKEKKICKAEPNSISRIPRKTCRTQAEWDNMARRGELDEAASTLRGISRGN